MARLRTMISIVPRNTLWISIYHCPKMPPFSLLPFLARRLHGKSVKISPRLDIWQSWNSGCGNFAFFLSREIRRPRRRNFCFSRSIFALNIAEHRVLTVAQDSRNNWIASLRRRLIGLATKEEAEQKQEARAIIETVNINISWKLKTARTREITKGER